VQHVHCRHLLQLGGAAVSLEAQQPEALLHAALGQAHLIGSEVPRQLSVDLRGGSEGAAERQCETGVVYQPTVALMSGRPQQEA
jgi:hypothetical protein